MLNDTQFMEAYRKLAERAIKSSANENEQLITMWRLAVRRHPDAAELAAMGVPVIASRPHARDARRCEEVVADSNLRHRIAVKHRKLRRDCQVYPSAHDNERMISVVPEAADLGCSDMDSPKSIGGKAPLRSSSCDRPQDQARVSHWSIAQKALDHPDDWGTAALARWRAHVERSPRNFVNHS